MRSLQSIVDRTPLNALKEIILVDDKSESKFPELQGRLDAEVARFPLPVRLFRMPQRSGLIRARLKGARESKGICVLGFGFGGCRIIRPV